MQCIDSTFNAHKLPGHDNIYNPVDNIIAGVRYAIDRYGSVSKVPGVEALARGDAYVGYQLPASVGAGVGVALSTDLRPGSACLG
jgi:SLT domain-containing protein